MDRTTFQLTRGIRLLMIGLTLLALLVATAPPPAQAAMSSTGFEDCLLNDINASRADAGAPALTLATDLDPLVRDWSEWMRNNTFRHMSTSERDPILPDGVTAWGENIAWTSWTADGACDQIHGLLMDSPPHKANILNPSFDVVALGAFGDSTGWWVTELFFSCEGSFCDDDSSIFQNDIELVAAADITKGCNPPTNDRFCPDEYVTRGAMAAFLARALDLTNTGNASFTDTNGSLFETDILKVAAAGITKGCNPPTNDRFCPGDYVTRGAMAAFLARALGL